MSVRFLSFFWIFKRAMPVYPVTFLWVPCLTLHENSVLISKLIIL